MMRLVKFVVWLIILSLALVAFECGNFKVMHV